MVKQKSRNKKSFVYSWNMANNLSNLGKGIVFENTMSDDGKNINCNIPTKRKIFFKTFFSTWNKISIAVANKIYSQLHNLKKNKKKESFIDVIFPFSFSCGKKSCPKIDKEKSCNEMFSN